MGARRPLDEVLAAERLLLTPEETAEVHRVGRTTIYALMKADDVRPVHIGCSCRISRAELERYVRRLETPPPSAAAHPRRRRRTHEPGGPFDLTVEPVDRLGAVATRAPVSEDGHRLDSGHHKRPRERLMADLDEPEGPHQSGRRRPHNSKRVSGESSIYCDDDGRWHGFISKGKESGRRDRRHLEPGQKDPGRAALPRDARHPPSRGGPAGRRPARAPGRAPRRRSVLRPRQGQQRSGGAGRRRDGHRPTP